MSDKTQQTWRKDFPIQWGADNYVTRREFTKFLVLVSGAACAGNGYFVFQRYQKRNQAFPSVEIGNVNELVPGQAKIFQYPDNDEPALLIRLQNGDFVAYKQRCTHLSCPVHFVSASNRLECPCHNGAFDASNGNVLEGPPPRPLPRITLRIENERIFAEGVQGS